MQTHDAIDLGRQALLMALTLGAPVLVVGAVIGLLVGLAQAVTQIQDQTIAFVPKILTMVLALALSLPWLIEKMVDYSHDLYMNIPRVLLGG